MEPLRPETKQRMLATNPQAQPGDLEEYERLLAARFAYDPDAPRPAAAPLAEGEQADRLQQLHRKLFPQMYGNQK